MCYPPGGKGCKACYNGQTVKRDKLCFSPIIVLGYIHTSVVLSPLTTVTPDPQGDPVAFEEDTSRQISPQGEDLVAGNPRIKWRKENTGSVISKHEISTQCWVHAGPTSKTVGQHEPSIGLRSRVAGCDASPRVLYNGPMLIWCWVSVADCDVGPSLNQH